MAVIQFAEVVQGTKTDLDAEKRIQEKEAIYRGLIEKEAVRLGKPFEEMEAIIIAEDNENEERRRKDGRASRNYEHELDRNIKAMRYFVEKFAPLIPEGVRIE